MLHPKDEYHHSLSSLAGRFRLWRGNEAKQYEAVKEYQATLRKFIASGLMAEALGPEDELPEDLMPKEYWEWLDGNSS